MKDGLRGQHFPRNHSTTAAVKQLVTSTGVGFYKHSMQALVHCGQKCITSGGDCVEKQFFVAENLLYNECYSALCVCCSFLRNK